MVRLAVVGLHLGPGSLGGVSNYTKLLLENIDRNEFDIHYYSLGKSPNWYEGEDKPTLLQFGVILIAKLILFLPFLKKNKIDVVHLNSGLTQISILREGILFLIAKFAGCKTLFFIHGWKEKEYKKISVNWIKKKLVKNVLNKQDSIIVLAAQFKEKLIDLDIKSSKIFVSSTMAVINNYKPEIKSFSKPYKVLFCANIVKEKGPYELLESIPLIINKFQDVEFIYIGDGNDLNNLKSKVKKLGVERNVLFTGYIPQSRKFKLFKESHIFAFPTYYGEGFPTVILEAMASGLSIITTPNGGLENALEEGRDGFILKTMPSKPEEIAEKIIQLLENPELMKKISNNNIKRANEEYDAKVVSNQISKIYKKIHT